MSFAIGVGSPTDRHIVAMSGGAAAASAAVTAAGGTIERSVPELGIYKVSGLDDTEAQNLRARRGVTAVGRDKRQQFVPPFSTARLANTAPISGVRPQGTDQSGAFFYPVQWNLHRIEAQAAWNQTPGGAGALVCVLDTGVDAGQADMVGKVDLTKSASMVASEPFIDDLHFHGTFVSSLVSANGLGMASVAPDAILCAVKVLDQTGSGDFFDVLNGIVFAANQNADVINMSLGGALDLSDPNDAFLFQLMHSAVTFARQKGALVVAATGNNGVDLDPLEPIKVVPAHIPGVIGTSATKLADERTEQIAPYSNTGQTIVDLAAPGGDFNPNNTFDLVLGACSRFVCGADNFYILVSGTSAATPHVSGVGALAESDLPGNQIEDVLRSCLSRSVNRLPKATKKQQGFGRVNARLAGLC
ncbi:MAG: S8 family serine peptidase [Gemmatimonadaceae bacterium]